MLWVVCVHHRWCFRGHKGVAPHRIFNCGGSTGEGTVRGVFLPGFFVVLFLNKEWQCVSRCMKGFVLRAVWESGGSRLKAESQFSRCADMLCLCS